MKKSLKTKGFWAVFLSVASLVLACGVAIGAAPSDAKFELRDGDRVALIGDTLFEREQTHSYLETLLTSRFPGKNITFRNLAWSGDTVFGHARAAFDTPEQGFERLIKVVHDARPTVLFVGYGMAESFDGEAGLADFEKGYNRLLDRLADLKARTVIFSPNRHEDLGAPFPSPDRHNADILRYTAVLKRVATERKATFVDLYSALGDGTKNAPAYPYTDNGIHPTAYGYWQLAQAVERAFGYPPRGWSIDVDATAPSPKATGNGVEVSGAAWNGNGKSLAVRVAKDVLPVPPPPPIDARYIPTRRETQRLLTVRNLPPGHWTVRVGDELLAAASSDEWAKGVALVNDALSRQAEKLRQVAVLKNMLFFNQWRPANETYLFGFRRNEQGQNAREMPMFDPPIAEKEAEIAKLRTAAPYEFRFEREDQ